jgi:hypothetical protein
MAELEPGRPDKLVRTLRNWLREARDPIGQLPTGTDPIEWAVRRFIASWVKPVKATVCEIEDCLLEAKQACAFGGHGHGADRYGLAIDRP